MFRLFTIFYVIWRFRLDDIILSIISVTKRQRLYHNLPARHHESPPATRLRQALEYLGPIFIKFGQLLSTRADLLPAPFIDELSKLQDRVPPHPINDIRASLEAAYGKPLTEIFDEFDESPVGSASIAQVHRARLADSGDIVAVKILRPNVITRIQKDLKLLRNFATILEWALKDSKRLQPQAIINEFAMHLSHETDLMREAANCSQISRNFANAAVLVVPGVYWRWCRQNVMVMEYIRATPISNIPVLREMGINLSMLAKSGIELFFTQVFRDSFFHADMHPGNLHVNDKGQFVLLDYGIVGSLNDFDKEYLARNFIAFFNRDYRAVAQMHVDAGWVPANTPVDLFESDIRAVCEPIFARPLKDISFGRFLLQMFHVAHRHQLKVQPQLLMLQKTLFNIEGIGRQLDPEINLWDTAKPFLESWAKSQYSAKRIFRLLQKQAPDWIAVLAALPPATRAVLQRHLQPSPAAEPRLSKLPRWAVIVIAVNGLATAVLIFFL